MLSRPVTFQFALDPTQEHLVLFAKCAGARRFTFNHHVARVKKNLDVRTQEKAVGEFLTASLSWSDISFINEFNASKNGKLDSSPENEDGTRGLNWRSEIPESLFEYASVDATSALKNWSDSKKQVRYGAPVGLVRFSSKGRCTCSGCAKVKTTLGLSTRVFVCEHCDLVIGRDHNAEVNLARWQKKPVLVST